MHTAKHQQMVDRVYLKLTICNKLNSHTEKKMKNLFLGAVFFFRRRGYFWKVLLTFNGGISCHKTFFTSLFDSPECVCVWKGVGGDGCLAAY